MGRLGDCFKRGCWVCWALVGGGWCGRSAPGSWERDGKCGEGAAGRICSGVLVSCNMAKLISASPTSFLPLGEDKRYQVDRRVLRSILLEGQNPYITYDATFTRYSIEPTGVAAHFADGSQVQGSLLVGADGTRSKVASQLVGAAASPRDLGLRLIYGKTPLTRELESALLPTLQKGIAFVTDTRDNNRLLLVMEPMRFHHQRAPQNYIFWGLAGVKKLFENDDEVFNSIEVETPADRATRLTSGWDNRIKIIIENQLVDQTALLGMSGSDPEGPVIWPTDRRVTLLGDAIHCMPPTGGQGANSAVIDAATLGGILSSAEQCEGGGWSIETVRDYEDAMRYNIGDIVGMACIGASKIIG